MGITGLLGVLKPTISSSGNIQDFSNQTIAIDASIWLQKGVYPCGERLVEHVIQHGIADKLSNHIVSNYIIKRCDELILKAKIKKILLVFDGMRCPLKKETGEARRKNREKIRKSAIMLKSQGKVKESNKKYMSCCKFTNDMAMYVAQKVEEKWKSNGMVKVILSPYEADSQLAFLCKNKMADAVITEDSDVLVYSASCNTNFPIITKLDRHNGTCDVYSMSWIDNPHMIQGKGSILSSLQLMAQRESKCQRSGRRMFVQWCVLSGNDYTTGIPGVGIVGALKSINEQSIRKPEDRFSFILARSRIAIKDQKEYEFKFAQIEAIFYYHYILNDAQKIVSLTDPSSSKHIPTLERFQNDTSFLGNPDDCAPSAIPSISSTELLKTNNNHSMKRFWSDTKSSCAKKQKTSEKKLSSNERFSRLISSSNNEKSEEEELQLIHSSLQTNEKPQTVKIKENQFASFINPYKDSWVSKTNNVTPSPLLNNDLRNAFISSTKNASSKQQPKDQTSIAKVDLFRDCFDNAHQKSNAQIMDTTNINSDSDLGVFPYDDNSPEKSKNQNTEHAINDRKEPSSISKSKNIEIIDLTPSLDSSISLFYDDNDNDTEFNKNNSFDKRESPYKNIDSEKKESPSYVIQSAFNRLPQQPKKVTKKKIIKKKVSKKGQMLKTIQSFFKPIKK